MAISLKKILREINPKMREKYQINEGIVQKIVTNIFALVLSGKTKAVINNIQNDPELAEYTKEIEKSRKNLEGYIERNKDKINPSTLKYLTSLRDNLY